MKNVIAKLNAKGATVFYRDGKRTSQAKLAAAYVDEARAEMTRQGVDVTSEYATGEDNKDGFVVEIRTIAIVPCYGGILDHADIDAVFTVNVETVTAGLQVIKAARKLENFVRATIFDAYEYADKDYERWHVARGTFQVTRSNGASVSMNNGRVFDALVDALGNEGFKPVADWQKAKADCDDAEKQLDIAYERHSKCYKFLRDKREYRDKAIIAKASSLTA